MFTRADNILLSGTPDSFRYHVIGFHWIEFEPRLVVFDTLDGEIKHKELENINLIFSEIKKCIGYFKDGQYHRCPHSVTTWSFPQCRSCASSWITVQECLYEPQCTGEKCDCRICKAEHVVYVAFIGKSVKVGMTQLNRLRERGIEQGADAISPLTVCDNRLEAREIEKKISLKLKIPQKIPVTSAVREITNVRPEEMLREKLKKIRERVSGIAGLVDEELIILDGYPVRSLKKIPTLVPLPGYHRGRVVGIKGKFLIYGDSSPRIINLSDAPARFLNLFSDL